MNARAAKIQDAAAAKIDRVKARGVTAERQRERRGNIAALVKTACDGLLNAYGEGLQSDIIDAMLWELCSRRKSLSDGPAVASIVGTISNTLNAEIKGGRSSARQAAEALFSEEGA